MARAKDAAGDAPETVDRERASWHPVGSATTNSINSQRIVNFLFAWNEMGQVKLPDIITLGSLRSTV
jgi:hypothetical protein